MMMVKMMMVTMMMVMMMVMIMTIMSSDDDDDSDDDYFRNTIRVSKSLDPDQDQHANMLLVLIWIQTVCKGDQQMTKVMASKERVELTRKFGHK